MIRHLELVNYRSHEHTSFSLEPLTVFIGPVAGGKSNIFRGLVLLQNAMTRSPSELFGPGPFSIWAQRHRGEANVAAPIGFRVRVDGLGPQFQGEEAGYSLFVNEGPEGPFIAEERLDRYRPQSDLPDQTIFWRRVRRDSYGEFGTFDASDRSIVGSVRHRKDDPSPNIRFASAMADQLSLIGYFHLEIGSLTRPSTNPQASRIGYRGEDLPAALALLRDNPDTSVMYERIVKQMRDLLPDLDAILLVPVEPERLGLGFQHRDFRGHLTPLEESDGTLYTLGLLALVHQPSLPLVLAIEEPETGLHPRRLRWVLDKLAALAQGQADTHPVQVLISTHSPYILDYFYETPEAVRVVNRIRGKTTVLCLLDAVGKYGITRDQLREAPLGEQWYAGLFEDTAACG